MATVRLGDLAKAGGCAAKYSAARLEELLAGFVPAEAENLLVGLNPADVLEDSIPPGSRAAQFSAARTLGRAATGEVSGSGITVPNLSVREDRGRENGRKSDKTPDETPGLRPIVYAEKVRSVSLATLSVPLRPASRTIPRAVEARFQGRDVYTMVIPIENLPAYEGDWILWFAVMEAKPGETPVMRAPVPFRKLERLEQTVSSNPGRQRVQIAAILANDGRLANVSLLTRTSPALEQVAIQDVKSWEFKPATRNGTPVDVEVVLEIPFTLPLALAQQARP